MRSAPTNSTPAPAFWSGLLGAIPLPDVTGLLLSTCDYWASDRPHQYQATGPPTGPPAAPPLRSTDSGPPSQLAHHRAA